MTSKLNVARVRGVLLDIEGTTTPISFVHDLLFSYARTNLSNYLVEHSDAIETRDDLSKLSAEHAADVAAGLDPPALSIESVGAELESLAAYINWLMDRDRKSPALKLLQGKIWQQGYLSGRLTAEVFNDVAPALKRWRSAGLTINIFSSGSVLAQKLLFAHTGAGDLTHLIDSYFDTSSGPKAEVDSYRRISASLNLPPQSVVFISDVAAELQAADAAGLQTLLCLRPGNAQQPALHSGGERFQTVETFENLLFEYEN